MSTPHSQIPYTVLIVEDDSAIAENLLLALESHDFTADIAHTARAAMQQLDHTAYDAVILDVGLPGMDGYRMLQQMRTTMQWTTPVLMLTARATLEDKLTGFSLGADDYLTKPFALDEVIARVKAIIRRSKCLSDAAFSLHFGPVQFQVAQQQVLIGGTPVRLTRKSVMILEMLMRYAGRVVPRQRLEDMLWQGEPPSTEALRSQIHLLRKTLHQHGFDGIETVHGTGWRLTADASRD
ncbi:MAG: response regulator transcription factor [Corticimicrobacter sp.]|uniref:response regulator transcription factor n=1 Tax=Corticimicrobacter sp. TaxID=2678536 RepID=UPI0032D9B786